MTVPVAAEAASPAVPAPLPAGLAEERPERGGAAWCLLCPQFWAAAGSRAEALSLVDEHMRGAHLDEEPR